MLIRSKHQNIKKTSLLHGIGKDIEVKNYYDNWSKNYDITLKRWNYTAPQKVAKILFNKTNVKKILDLACGTGLSGEALKKYNPKILDGADISTKSLEISCQKFIYDKLYKFNFQKKKFNFRVQKYDCIVCVGSLTYCEDFNLLINKLEKKLIKKGYFIFTHRNDLWKKDHFTKLIKNLKNWKIIYTSNLLEYLPLNKDFSDKIKIRICLLRKK